MEIKLSEDYKVIALAMISAVWIVLAYKSVK